MSVLVKDTVFTTTLIAVTCGECGIAFGMPEHYYEKRLEDRNTWYCPNGHCRHFTGERETDRLRQQLDSAKRDADHQRQMRTAEERKNRALRGELTKTKKRISHGVCPCCNRTFQNLSRHMAGQHPEYATTEGATV